jgi:Fe-S cluster assembly iron-binding protein IscA
MIRDDPANSNPTRSQAAVHEQASRVAARGHGCRYDLMTEQSSASRSVTHDNGRIHHDHNSHRYLRGTTLDHECADARLVHAERHDCADD